MTSSDSGGLAKPELAVNRSGETVADALSGFITHAATDFVGGARLDIATAYFNIGGYMLLADSLDQLNGARILVGAEPTPPEYRRRKLGIESPRPERAARARLSQALANHQRDLATERDMLGFSLEADAAAQRLVGWLRSGCVEVRRLEDRFLHGKAFLVSDRSHGVDRRQRVLVITPATLRDGPWRAFKNQHMLPMELISYEELMADHRLNPGHGTQVKLRAGINEYAMMVIDEAHNLRNPATQRADALRRLLAGSPPKQLVLLTATPVNNSLWDLYYQLGYFLRNDAAFADVGIPSMRDHFARAMSLNPDDLTPEHLFDVLDAVAVRRTRSFVKQYYPNDTVPIDGRDQIIAFPTPRVRRVSYDLDAMLPGFFDRIARALDPDATPGDPESLTLARYVPSMYRLDQSPIVTRSNSQDCCARSRRPPVVRIRTWPNS